MLPLFSVMALMMDAARVIEMRLLMMAQGDGTADEIMLMVTEKISAMEEASSIILGGGSPSHVIHNYQRIVAANVARLSRTKH